MIIRSHKDAHIEMGVMVILSVLLLFLFWIEFGIKIAIVSTGWVILFSLNQWFAIAKTLIMDSEGCTVQILFLQKKYLWKELKVKRIERWDGLGCLPSESLPVERRGIIFSKSQIGKSERPRPEDYALFRPFFLSYFFVYFSMNQPLIRRGCTVSEKYNVDEEKFMAKMHEWNVELDVSMEQKSSYMYSDNQLILSDMLKAKRETQETIKAYVQKENQKLRDSITGYTKCRVYKILEMLKYNHEIGILVNFGEDFVALRCIHEKNRNGNTVKTFYIEDEKYERLEEIREILDRHCDEAGFLCVGLVDSSLLDCRRRYTYNE